MALQIATAIAVFLTMLWGVLKYCFNPKRKKEQIEKKIRYWEGVLANALKTNDGDRATMASHELQLLREALHTS